jgi:GT2 family glycosyltransferase
MTDRAALTRDPTLDGVTVVILTHNRANELSRTLGRIQELGEASRIIVVDNGSSDRTGTMLSRWTPVVDVIRLPENRGAAARNLGCTRAVTPYVALCDDDTWWAPGSLTRAASVLDAAPRAAVVTARVVVGLEGQEDPASAEMAASPLPRDREPPIVSVLGFLAGACMVRRRALLAVGGFSSRLFLGGEEALVAIDLATRGWQLLYDPATTVHHHPSTRREAGRRRRRLARNELWIAWMRRPLLSAARVTARIVSDRGADGVLGLAFALRGIGWALRNRRVVPSDVERSLRLLEAARKGRGHRGKGTGGAINEAA